MINELEKLNEIYIKYRGEKTKLYFEKKESNKPCQYFNQRELEIDKKYAYYMKKRDELFHNIYINSYFSIKQIGPILAELISEFEGEKYIFDEGIILITQIEFYEIFEIPKYNTKYNCAIITNSSLSNINKQNNIELYPYEKIDRHINGSDLVLYFDSSPEKEINFYDNSGKYLFENKYSYIKDFIDTIIVSKINNQKEFNINEELRNFILENKPKVKKL